MKEFPLIPYLVSIFFPSSGKRIVITEGELDAASCWEAMDGWPMVSLPHGAASAKKDIQKQIPFYRVIKISSYSLIKMKPEKSGGASGCCLTTWDS